jgi:hypothetical protein
LKSVRVASNDRANFTGLRRVRGIEGLKPRLDPGFRDTCDPAASGNADAVAQRDGEIFETPVGFIHAEERAKLVSRKFLRAA